ncbi:MAG: hypothetical protein RR709_02755 [Ruthenibacterium sp.]
MKNSGSMKEGDANMHSTPRQGSAALAAYRQRIAKKRKKLLFVAALTVVTAASFCWIFWHTVVQTDPTAAPTVSGRLSEQEIASQLQAQVDAGMFSCEINPAPVFEHADSKGVLAIRNGPSNAQDMRVSITLDDTGETVYISNVLHPGEQKVEDTLSHLLSPGQHAATAQVEVLKPLTENVVAKVQMALTIVIKA